MFQFIIFGTLYIPSIKILSDEMISEARKYRNIDSFKNSSHYNV
jgi:hypothetical protein